MIFIIQKFILLDSVLLSYKINCIDKMGCILSIGRTGVNCKYCDRDIVFCKCDFCPVCYIPPHSCRCKPLLHVLQI